MRVDKPRGNNSKKLCGEAWLFDVDPNPRKSKKRKGKRKKRTACHNRRQDWSNNKANKKACTSKVRVLTPVECQAVEARNLKAGNVVGRGPVAYPAGAYRK